ncbi:MAG: ABC transporter ATP-binding protein [Chloroflexota bacterium]|nr:ABC transporter ATP-binding protein [Chloroflexota bacterium]
MLQLKDLSHAYDEAVSLRNVNLRVAKDEILCLLGPSGCGKTTLLRIVAGLISDYGGDVLLDGRDLRRLAAHERGFGLMFQDFALFPHLSVSDNIAYGLRRRRMPATDINERVELMLDQVGLRGYGERGIGTLSGGEQQRVALARSLAPQPRLLMLDEPLGSLDALLRDKLALELREIINSAGLRALYVTHDHREAYAIADRVAVMDKGTIRQVAGPFDLYHHPIDENVARFLGFSNIFQFGDNRFTRELRCKFLPDAADSDAFLIHPDGIQLNDEGDPAAIARRGRIESSVFRGEYSEVSIRMSGEGLTLRCKSRTRTPTVGNCVTVSVKNEAIRRLK